MIQNPQHSQIDEIKLSTEQKPLQIIIDSLLKNQNRIKLDKYQNKSYDILFQDIKDMFYEIDNHIDDCKRYNEAKTKRKYERRIQELQNDLKILRDKVKQLERTRSPSKKYIDDLVDKLVLYKNHNQKLIAENQKLKKQGYFKDGNKFGKQDDECQDNDTKGATVGYQVSNKRKQFSLKQQILQYIQSKQGIKIKQVLNMDTKFLNFLNRNLGHIGEWSFNQFLINIDKQIEQNYIKSEKTIEKLRRSLVTSLSESTHIITNKLPRLTQVPYNGMKYSIGNLKDVNKRGKMFRNSNITMEVMSLRREKVTLK